MIFVDFSDLIIIYSYSDNNEQSKSIQTFYWGAIMIFSFFNIYQWYHKIWMAWSIFKEDDFFTFFALKKILKLFDLIKSLLWLIVNNRKHSRWLKFFAGITPILALNALQYVHVDHMQLKENLLLSFFIWLKIWIQTQYL